MHIRYGYAIEIDCPQPTPLILRLDVHPDQRGDITDPERFGASDLLTGREVSVDEPYLDTFGTLCRRLVAPQGRLRLEALGQIYHSGFPDARREGADQLPPEDLPPAVLPYLSASRYCESDLLAPFAWQQFGPLPNGWARVSAVCDFVHHHLTFDYLQARDTRTAFEAFSERVGVCRDFTHLAVALCRALNIPARYCNGYLGDIGVPECPDPMDFSAWFEVYLEGAWWTFDARHNMPRIGRIVIARGLDAADVPMISSFGLHTLARFEVITQEVMGDRFPVSSAERRHERAEPPPIMALW